MNKDPIEDRASIRALRCWMDREGLCSLWDISLWCDSIWAGWKHIEVPVHLANEWSTLLDLLHGLAPTRMRKRDSKGWGRMPVATLSPWAMISWKKGHTSHLTLHLGRVSGVFLLGPKSIFLLGFSAMARSLRMKFCREKGFMVPPSVRRATIM